jgi:hypothetical protein
MSEHPKDWPSYDELIDKYRAVLKERTAIRERREYWYNYAMMTLRQLDRVQKACARHKRNIKRLRNELARHGDEGKEE